MQTIMTFFIFCIGVYLVLSAFKVSVPGRVKKAVKARNETGLSDMQQMMYKASVFLSKYIKLTDEKQKAIETSCRILNKHVTPQLYTADIIVSAAFYSMIGFAIMTFSVPLGIVAAIAIFLVVWLYKSKQLKKEILQRKILIEKELPQFAGTIRQQLTSTRDIVTILSAYRKVSGDTLKHEITKTLNDIKTSNVSVALQNLERRIGSSKLSELVRGLLGVYHGEDQTMFFEFLTKELIKHQTEIVARELEQRPSKLTVNFILAALAFAFMAIASLSGNF